MISPSLSPHCSSSSSSSFLWVMRSERAPRTDVLPNIRPIIGVPKESAEGEKRVAITPSAVSLLLRFNYSVLVEENAGKAAQFDDDEYLLHGATIVSKQEIWQAADIIVKVQPPTMNEAGRMRPDSRLIAFMQARDNADVIDFLHSEKNVTIFAMDQVPRNVSLTSRYFDAVYSQASIAGYRAVLEGISQCDKFLARATSPPLSTSEEVLRGEKVPPLNVLVLGGGISGIAAIKTARSLGASVACYDDRNVLRPLVTSLGASFFTSPTPYQENGEIIPEVQRLFPKTDLIICTIFPNHNQHTTPSRSSSSPHFLLRKKTLLSAMPSGGVIVDMTVAPETGRGNVEGAEPDMIMSLTDRIFRKKLKIIGFTDFPSRMAKTSSMLYANNVLNVLFALHPHRDVVMKTRLTTSEEEAATAFIPSSTSSSTTSAYWMGEVAEGGYDVAIDKIIGAMEVKDPVREVQAAVARVKTKVTSSTSKGEQGKETRATSQPQQLQPLRSTSSSSSSPTTTATTFDTTTSSTTSSAYFYSYKNKTRKNITAETSSTPQIKSDSITTATTDKKEKEEKSDKTDNITTLLPTTTTTTTISSEKEKETEKEKEKEIIIILPPQPIVSPANTITTTTTSTTPINSQTEATNQPVTETQTQTLTPPTASTTPQTTNSTLSTPTTTPNSIDTTTTNEQSQHNKSLLDDSSQAFPTLSDNSDTAPVTTNNHETTDTSHHNSIDVHVNTAVNTSVKPLSTALPLSEKTKTKSPKKRMRKREIKNKIIDEQEEVRRRLRIVDMDENLAEQYSLLSSLSSPTVVPLTASGERNEVEGEAEVDVDDMDEEEYRYYYEDDRDSDSDPETDNDFDYIPEDEEEEDIAEMDPARAMHTSVKRSQGEEGTGEEEE
eukprot:gene14562-16125_t